MPTLSFDVIIQARRPHVWAMLFEPEGYRAWTAAFCEGSHFVGSWETGSRMHFLAPSGDGMVAEIAENRLHEFLAIRHLGMIENGVEDTTSEAVRAWAPACETYRLTDMPGGCRLDVQLDTATQWEDSMRETFPRALARLKVLCESAPGG